MGVDMKVKAIYDSEIGNITRSEKNWKDVLKVAGQLYRYEFDNIVMVTAQRPPEKSTLMADYDTWKKVGRYVKRGAKGCAIFPSRALNPRMRYIFDISDTGGKNVKLTWDLEGENLKDYLDFLVSEGQIEQYDNSDRESLKNILKQFTGTDVWLIIKEEFGDRMTELMQLSGSVIKEESKKRNGLQQEMDMEQLVYASVMYAVGTRCGFDLSVQEQDFSQIVNIKDEEIIYRLGSIVCDVSCSVLREFSRNLKAIESERRIGYVRRNDLQGSGRTALSADRDAGRDGGSHEAGQIRKDGDELSKGERAGKIQDADEIREDVREDVSGRGGSEPAVRPAGDAVSGEAQATESVIDNGDVEDKRAGEDAGRGSGTPSDSDAIPLESDDTELNRELDEINSLGVSKEAEYTQASFFFDQNGQASIGTIHTEDENNNQFMRQFEQDRKAALAGKYNYLNPKKSATVPGEYIKQVLMRGTGFVGGKGRVCKIFETEIDAGTRAKRIKAEYGQGGAGWPVDGLGLHGYDTFHGNGLRFQWRDEDGEVEGYVSWKDIEKELGVLILTGEYQPETPRIDELAMDGLREDDEVIDAEYREVEPEEAESEIDDYAIPDEPESYASNRDYVSAKGMTPQEAADEDRMVTQAEYGAEIEAETSEKDPSELKYITPIDYAKRIAELDEDLRDAAEILVTDCSCYTPFRAFLMDVVQSDFAFIPNKLDLIRDIALGTDNAERKAYSNNKYGLVEYSIRSGYVKISYKNRNGVRKEGALDWRELYEILSYMVKQPFYCGEDQKKYYQETKQKADRDKMNPVYKRFFDIEDSVKANRLETRERAIANGWETKIDENGHVVSDDAVQKKHNFHYNLWEMEKGGAKTRYQWNMDAIRTLKQIESENRLATPEEQKTLSKFVGWGGLSQAFDENNAGWSKEYAELKDLLSDEEYSAARATVNNAFYTSPEIAMCINSALVQFGFRGGNVLEPSMGIGNFFGSMPAPMQRSKLYGVELDSISGRIAKQLYQNANISITGFENTTYPDNFFDVVVGNVPFGDYKVFDPKYNKYNFRIHDYFLAKALDQVRPGGMVAVITTKGTLDKANPTIRKYLAERAELVGAVRLPNTAFKDNAGTEVTADILFLQKRERKIDIEPDWVHLGVTENGIAVNSYFAEHPEMMLGSMEYDTRIYGQDSRYTVCVNNVPALRGGKPIIVESEPDWYVKQVMEDFVVRAERIRGGGVDPSVDNFLKITHEARLLGTDARLIDKDAPNNPDGKLNKVAENVWKEYEKGNANGHIGCQLIFSDIGTPGPDKDFTIYDYLKETLIQYGIPAEEIAFIHDAKTDAQRDALFKEMRTGKKKVLIGSTDKCGTGVNVQTHLVAMHHVDCPWKPSSIEQREGRGIRQGNENEEVAIYRYVTKGTFDAYNWSLVENKQRFISQVMTSKAVSRSCEDIDEATLSYAEIKAVATGNPLIREKMEIDNDVQRLKLLKASYDNQRYGLQDNFMIKYPKLIKTATEKLANVREDVKARDKELIDNPEFAITIGKATYTERVDGGTMMLEAISKCKTGETTAIGKFHGFELLVEKNFLGINYMVLRGKTEYKAELSTSPVGSMVKLENLFNGLHENIDFLEKKIEQYQNDLEASKAEYDKPFAYSKELEEKLSRQCELNAQLDLENAKAVDADLSGPEEEREADDRMESAAIVAEDKGAYQADREGRTR